MRAPSVLVVVLAVLAALPARAQTTAERGASVLIFPEIVADADADTLVQIANLSASRVDVFCSYVAGASGWQATGFSLALVAEQPLYWSAARGRSALDGDDPNAVPAAGVGFRGQLLCVEVDVGGAPESGDHLVGRASVTALAGGDAFAYAALGLESAGFNDGDDVLCVGGEPSDTCFVGAEYSGCPAAWIVSHPSSGAPDAQLGGGATQDTRVVLVPCSQNLRDAQPATVGVSLQVTNELEQRFSAAADVTCWSDRSLAEISPVFTAAMLGSPTAQTRFSPRDGAGGFALLAKAERRAAGGAVLSRSALAAQQEGAAAASDAIILPMGRP